MIPVFDNHVHLQKGGENVNAAKRYEGSGGKIINICNLPLNFRPSLDYFIEMYEDTIRIAEDVRRETSLKVLVTIGPYPVDVIRSVELIGFEKTEELFLKATEIAARFIMEGKANAIGEIGRPHFKVDKKIWDFSNSILEKQMGIAKDFDLPVVLHTESASESTFREISVMAERAGIKKWKVVKHYSPPLVLENENHGIFPSVISSRDNVRNAIKKGLDFFMETDFLDDPERKGAVMDIETVPKRFRMLEQEYPGLYEKYLDNLKRNIIRIYGVEISD
ncbi:MAG: TatD family hydrolase [Thermoplasmata archaeon]